MAGRSRKPEAEANLSEDDWSTPPFVCERVCVSDKLVRKVGSGAKEATPGNCVTVCGVSSVDACTEACHRAVCVVESHVPKWNEQCIKRCTAECLKAKQ